MDKKRQGKINRNKGAILERETAKKLEKFGGKRVVRGDWSISEPDIVLEKLPHFKLDCKKYAKHFHHTLFEEIEKKYCGDTDEAILITQKGGSKRTLVTIDMDLFVEMLERYI